MAEKIPSFEEVYLNLEKIAEKLSENDLPLDEAIKLYEEGVKLSKFCAETLEKAKQKIEVLKSEN